MPKRPGKEYKGRHISVESLASVVLKRDYEVSQMRMRSMPGKGARAGKTAQEAAWLAAFVQFYKKHRPSR